MVVKKLLISVILVLVMSAGIFFFFFQSSHSKPILKVLTYSSFLSPYGPATKIKKEFEKMCQCTIRWMKAENSTAMSSRLHLRSDGMGIDVVLGFDQLTLSSTYFSWKWKELTVPHHNQWVPVAKQWLQYQKHITKQDMHWAVPISWSPLSFIVRKSYPPMDLSFLATFSQWEKNISIPDPRYSTLGLQFYFWLFVVIGPSELEKFLKKFKKQLYRVSHSWSSAYGLFQKKFADVSFSYQTSLMYHQLEEDQTYFAISFQQGHPYQVEFTAIPNTCKQCHLATQFVQFLLKPSVQKILMRKNYMLPIVSDVTRQSAFEDLPKLPLISYEKLELFLSQKQNWIQKWEKSLNIF